MAAVASFAMMGKSLPASPPKMGWLLTTFLLSMVNRMGCYGLELALVFLAMMAESSPTSLPQTDWRITPSLLSIVT